MDHNHESGQAEYKVQHSLLTFIAKIKLIPGHVAPENIDYVPKGACQSLVLYWVNRKIKF